MTKFGLIDFFLHFFSPSNNFYFYFFYTWHVTRDTRHVTRHTWHMTHSGGWTFSQNISFLALPVCDWQYLEYISTNHRWVTLFNYEAAYRTAPATPGLLNIAQGFPKTVTFLIQLEDLVARSGICVGRYVGPAFTLGAAGRLSHWFANLWRKVNRAIIRGMLRPYP